MADEELRYQNIIHEPAHRLLNLSDEELDMFIGVARKAECEARTIGHWLLGIKDEKARRQGTADWGSPSGEPTTLKSSFPSIVADTPLDEEELEVLRRRAWHEQGLLIVDPWDYRLTSSETQTLRQIASRFYGSEGQR